MIGDISVECDHVALLALIVPNLLICPETLPRAAGHLGRHPCMYTFSDSRSELYGLLTSITATHNEHTRLISLMQTVLTRLSRGVDRAFVEW